MTTAIIAIVITVLIIAAVCALIYSQVDPVRPDPSELADKRVSDIICGTGTEAPLPASNIVHDKRGWAYMRNEREII
ncbi:hypothetical protein ABID21_001890 [Pseudorhizobium tarimense]|uniref:Uncharacterized protein n=1 Tax=Pseudorhizobium tarimense TaxID=1079109 RepID=A0ABV2H5L4_9HYPH|nr:hypothetical protein [Pseudorhizobium tarimense]MCJ8518986.1 hypothetical protein [Pseudorhizobium tarimense]